MRVLKNRAVGRGVHLILAGLLAPSWAVAQGEYASKTLYHSQQSIESYEVAPEGFKPVYVEIVARHGARSLSKLKDDAALYNLWLEAKKRNALTPLGVQLGAAIQELMQANIKVGYGNLTAQGQKDHQELAQRLWQRMSPLFTENLAQAKSHPMIWQSSGVDRARDSAEHFVSGLLAIEPKLKGLMVASPKITDASGTDIGINRYELYFQGLKNPDAGVAQGSLYEQIYQGSLAHQKFMKKNDELNTVMKDIRHSDAVKSSAQRVLTRLFTTDFVKQLSDKDFKFTAEGTFHGVDLHGATVTLKGNSDKVVIKNAVGAVESLYGLYSVVPAFGSMIKTDWSLFMPDDESKVWAYVTDAQDFYQKGPSFADVPQNNTAIAKGLLIDFFKEIDGLNHPQQAHIAKFRFAHAETIMPFVGLLGLEGASESIARDKTYTYATNPWRGAVVSPFTANVQWDVYQNPQGQYAVKMLYNEKETAFKSQCDGAKLKGTRYFYEYIALRKCYAQELSPSF